jgi:hypothetical protein
MFNTFRRFAFIASIPLLVTCCEQAEYASFENDCNCETQVYAQKNVMFDLKQHDKNDAYQMWKFYIMSSKSYVTEFKIKQFGTVYDYSTPSTPYDPYSRFRQEFFQERFFSKSGYMLKIGNAGKLLIQKKQSKWW